MQHKEFLLHYAQDRGYRKDFFASIHENDEMYYKAILPGYKSADLAARAYMQSGGRMLDVVSQLLKFTFADTQHIDFLEFASGYGRFTRHLVQILESNHIWVSDIYKPAVDWLNKNLLVNGFYSAANPVDICIDRKFDFIFVGSLFSHLPKSLFVSWLSTLFHMLKDGGILALSVHDIATSKSPNKDFIYHKWSESDTLSTDIYGMTYVSPNFVKKSIAQSIDTPVDTKRRVCGLYEGQDLYILSNNRTMCWQEEDLHISPLGGYEGMRSSGGTFIIIGWGVSLDCFEDITEANVIFDDDLIIPAEITKDTTGRIKKYFPHAPNEPLLWNCVVDPQQLAAAQAIRCRLGTKSGMFFDAYVDKKLLLTNS
jgi:SAM-dependent methyltransferase